MKIRIRVIALLLCAAMVFGLAGCAKPAAEPTSPPTTETTTPLPDGTQIYSDAAAWAKQAGELVLHITTSRETQVAGSTFTNSSEQVITYAGLGTNAVIAQVEAEFDYGDYTSQITEIYSDGTVYAAIGGYSFSSLMTYEDFIARYAPALLLDETLYREVVTNEDGTAVTFTGATALENWLASDITQLVEASGSVSISTDGKLKSSSYTAVYTQSNATITDTYTVRLEAPTETDLQIPADTSTYIPVESLDAIRLSEQAYGYLQQANTVSSNISESIVSQAAATLRTTNVRMNTSGSGSDRKLRVEHSISQISSGIK